MTVRRRAQHRLGRDIAARAWAVFDDYGLLNALRQPCRHDSRNDVGSATGWKSNDPAQRAAWIGLRPTRRLRGKSGNCAERKLQQPAPAEVRRCIDVPLLIHPPRYLVPQALRKVSYQPFAGARELIVSLEVSHQRNSKTQSSELGEGRAFSRTSVAESTSVRNSVAKVAE